MAICPNCGQAQENCICGQNQQFNPEQKMNYNVPFQQDQYNQQQYSQPYNPQYSQQYSPYQQYPNPNRPQRQRAPRPVNVPSYTTSAMAGDVKLMDGEQKVRTFVLGKYPGDGVSSITVTNRRVILREKYQFLFLSNDRMEEQNLDTINGISASMSRTISLRTLVKTITSVLVAILFWIFAGVMNNMGRSMSYYGNPLGGVSTAIGVIGTLLFLYGVARLVLSILFPTATFSVIGAASTSRSLMAGINTKDRAALSEGTLFRFRPTQETAKIIEEAGACIYDLKTKGDTAIAAWKQD